MTERTRPTRPGIPPRPAPHRDPIWLAYRAALLLVSPIWVPYAAWRLLFGRSRDNARERFGGGRHLPRLGVPLGIRAWFHGVSVGEIEALAPVVAALRAEEPTAEIVISSTTPTGRARADVLYPEVLERRFAPIDLPWTTARALRRIRPTILVLGESELWPSLIRQGAERAPIVVVNARLSDRTMARARRLRPLYRWMLRRLTAVGVQTAEDRDRFIELGLHPERITVTGNTKFDRAIPSPTEEDRQRLRRELGLGDAPLLVAGSTFPGEDDLVLDAFAALRDRFGLKLLIAPRHPPRADAVAALARGRGFRVRRRSEGPIGAPRRDSSDDTGATTDHGGGQTDPDVVILDTVGELASIYALARVAVIGRSFRTGGGQNPLEPMAHGIPVVHGPRMENFREITRLAAEGGAALRCESDEALTPALASILDDPERHASMAAAGPRILDAHRGAAARSAGLILDAAGVAGDPSGARGGAAHGLTSNGPASNGASGDREVSTA